MTLAFSIAHPRLGADGLLRTGEALISALARTVRTSNWRPPVRSARSIRGGLVAEALPFDMG